MVWTAMVLIAGCGSKKSNQADEIASELGSAPATTAPRRPYVISDAGVRFNPPVSWDVARIEVVSRSGKEAAAAHPGARFSVSFDYRAEQPAHKNMALLRLHVIHSSAWADMAKDSPHVAVIDSTDEWVYIASMPEDNPYRAGLLDADQFEAMRLSLDEIRDAFRIENGGPTDATLSAESKRE